ncbi:MAG TPA: response regulator [Syntrophorhabdaceae bacterium]|nr:response regulator [Syntrophorhabdaceae bacterium]
MSSVLDKKKILAVDDEPDILDVLEIEISAACTDCIIHKATSYDAAIKLLQSRNYDLVILDIMGVQGFDLLQIIVKNNMKAVMLTAHALTPENLNRARDLGARAFLPKTKIREIVPFLEDVFKYDFESGWIRVLAALKDVFVQIWGRRWDSIERDVGKKMPDA